MEEDDRARWRQFGAELHRMRQSSGMTQRQLATKMAMHYTMIGKLERLERSPKREQAEELDRALETGGTLSRLWHELTNRHYVPEWFKDALLLEQRATEIRAYESLRIPGLLQTRDYARVLLEERQVTTPPDQIEQMVETRTERMSMIRSNRPLLWFVIKESAFLDPVGDERVMRGQIRHILDLADEGVIRVQVLPTPRSSLSLCEPFRVMVLSGTQTVGYVENMLGGGVIDSSPQVQELNSVFGLLAAEGLPFPQSIAHLRKISGERYGDLEEEHL
ncbi:helix-turn-helix domain-containing protein [Streptomonospora alba]|uniref:helix-turn-helix domain-containing protein n=1 Tax=Streptomonospora alba TaxID=183763 RepID=UPI0014703CD1|nr:helix-turn-helix transcriptional regulator [Streptomonospora alba]